MGTPRFDVGRSLEHSGNRSQDFQPCLRGWAAVRVWDWGVKGWSFSPQIELRTLGCAGRTRPLFGQALQLQAERRREEAETSPVG